MPRGVVAAGRRQPTNVTGDWPSESAKAAQSASAQEKGQPQSSKYRNVQVTRTHPTESTIAVGKVLVAGDPYVGNQLKTMVSNKGTDVFGRPSSIGLNGRRGTLPAVENPDGTTNRPGTRRK